MMNKIYKVIWSKVKNCYVVVSELAKNRTKSTKKSVTSKKLEDNVILSLCNSAVCVPVFSTGFVAPIATNTFTLVKKEWDKPFKITVAAIVKNEAENVSQWVAAARSCADEIVVVDTGSTDGTVERFADYGIKCFHYDWHDDFASAKNYMISLCHGDWIVLLDGDEWFREGCDVRKAIAKHHGNPITKAIIADWICLDKDRNNAVMFSGGAVRAFRNQPDVRYFRKVHENLTINYENFVFEPDFKMYHTGYSGSVNRSKHERNLRIMRTMFDFDNGKVEYPTDWRYIEDTYAGLGEFDKALWAADKMIGYGVQGYSASAWVTKFNVLFCMKADMERMNREFDYCFRTVPSVSGFRFLASVYYMRNGRPDIALEHFTEGVRMLMGPQDRVAMEHTYWRMYLPEATALVASYYLQHGQSDAVLVACSVCEQYCGKTNWVDPVFADVRRQLQVLGRKDSIGIGQKVLPLLESAKKGIAVAAMVSGVALGTLGFVDDVFAASCVLNGSGCASGMNATVTGGCNNKASGDYSIVSGGHCNTASYCNSAVFGGANNVSSCCASVVVGGGSNKAAADYSVAIGGVCSSAYAWHSVAIGGGITGEETYWNYAQYSVAIGSGAHATENYQVAIGSACAPVLIGGDFTVVGKSVSGGCYNTASGCYSSVSGGYGGKANCDYSSVSGGWSNTASGCYSSVTGGSHNTASGYDSSVSGGLDNTASGCYSSVSGGDCNTANGYLSSISGGHSNTASGCYSSVSGGYCNTAACQYSSVSGGFNNTAACEHSSVSGGTGNIAGSCWSSVSGGNKNTASCYYASISGGHCNTASGSSSSVSGGTSNIASGYVSSVSSGCCNTASGYVSSVTGGVCNTASGYYSLVSGGYCNTASCSYSSVSGGSDNIASGCYSLAAGGCNGKAYANYSTAIGGGITGILYGPTLAQYSVAIGSGAKTTKDYEIAIGSACAPVKIDGALTVDGVKTVTDGTNSKTWSDILTAGCYTLPAATDSALGGVKVGSNITNNDGTISLTKTNVTDALGYTPSEFDTTYDNMSASELSTGTATTARSISAKVLADYVTGEISDEATARTTAINSEATTRADADTALGTQIDNIISAYESADTGLSNRIGSLSVDGNYIKKSDTNDVSANLLALDSRAKTNADDIATEITNRGVAISGEATARSDADLLLSNRIGTIASDGNYIQSANDVSANLQLLDAQIKDNANTLISQNTSITTLDNNAIKYDTSVENKARATLGGTQGTVLANLKSGAVTQTSMEAINGSQLYAVKQDITGFASDIRANASNIDALNSSVTAALSSVSASGVLVDTLDSSKADKSLSNLSDAGKRLLKTYAEDAVATYLAEQGLSIPAAPMAMNNGTVSNGNTLSITNAGNGSLHVGEGSYVNGTSSIAIGVGNQVNANNSGAFGDPSIINADASYVLGNDDTINTGATGSFIVGNDGVSDAKGGLLFGSNTKASAEAEDGMALGNRAEVFAKNAIALGSSSIADTENTLSIGNSNLKRKIVNVADGDISQNSNEAVTGAQLFLTNEKVQQNTDAIAKKADIDASNINTSDWATKLGIGKVEDGNTDLITGGTVYDAIQSVKGNELVQTNGDAITIGATSTATMIDVSNANGQGRVITGVITDVDDATSAANVGYVNQISENIARSTNAAFQKMDNRINKVGANAAAIASLPTPTFDGDEKWAFSAGIGHYHGETAASAGAFYKPQDNVIVRVGGSFGNGDEMVGAGVSVSLNKGNTPAVSKAQLVRTINAQAGQIQQQAEKINAQDNEIQNMKVTYENKIAAQNEEIAQLKVMMADLAAKVK